MSANNLGTDILETGRCQAFERRGRAQQESVLSALAPGHKISCSEGRSLSRSLKSRQQVLPARPSSAVSSSAYTTLTVRASCMTRAHLYFIPW